MKQNSCALMFLVESGVRGAIALHQHDDLRQSVRTMKNLSTNFEAGDTFAAVGVTANRFGWMRQPMSALIRHRFGLWACLAWALYGCMSPIAGAQAPVRIPAAMITEITLERGCFGCADGSALAFRSDGTATLVRTGNARSGTLDLRSTGTIVQADFEKLATMAWTKGFFELKDSYQDPQIQDGPWVTTGVTRGGVVKRVFRRDDAGPASLREMEAAIEALQSQVRWTLQ